MRICCSSNYSVAGASGTPVGGLLVNASDYRGKFTKARATIVFKHSTMTISDVRVAKLSNDYGSSAHVSILNTDANIESVLDGEYLYFQLYAGGDGTPWKLAVAEIVLS